MIDSNLEAFATAFIKQWLQDRCPDADPQVLQTMLSAVPDSLRVEAEKRQEEWRKR
jgi:hypothetical protein